ncbi:MAG: 3-phosphoshikimate 1-carboxyvinyltransferase, partial [bacterium]|nr:3-phosphoshikimate 1-carboxyvinyltransferase [bacterium]
MKQARIHPQSPLRGSLQVPGDKSISHRAIIFSALANGVSELRGLLHSEDVRATMGCFRELGVPIETQDEKVIVHGVGLKGLQAPTKVLDCGNSGTTMRLMMGLLAAQPFVSRLTGDPSLNRRPMGRVIQPLKSMGANIEEERASETERVIRIEGRPLRGIRYEMPVASAQVKSALLLAGLYASGRTEVVENQSSRNHTELILKGKGAALQISDGVYGIQATPSLKAENLEIPGDISSAAFFLVGGAINPGSEIALLGVGVNPTRTGILDVLQAMGAKVQMENPRQVGGEPVADLKVEYAPLRGTEVAGPLIPRLIDEIPILALAGLRAQGRTLIRQAEELRVKETDRIGALVENFQNLSINIKELPDGMEIEGPQEIQGGKVLGHGDHRMVMT